jgi:hypothetical protein
MPNRFPESHDVRKLETLRDLVAHKGHSHAALLNSIRQNEAAAADPELWNLLHHILLANRFWLLRGALVALRLRGRIARLRILRCPGRALFADAGAGCSESQWFVQVCLHSHDHRAQAAKLHRRHGGTPPATDFIDLHRFAD